MRNLKDTSRIVVKVGTSTLTNDDGTFNKKAFEKVVDVLASLHKSGKDIVLVTCGAIPLGVAKLKLVCYPSDMKVKQAASSVGQGLLMGLYDKAFGKYGITVGQLLLTKYTNQRDDTLTNATNTLIALFSHRAIPIINQNDPIIVDEIVLGDNDALAGYVASIVQADLLIFLTSTDGLYNKDPKAPDAKIIPEITALTNEIKASAGGTSSNRSTGGMATKLAAAMVASRSPSKTKTLIMNGKNPTKIFNALKGEQVGTYIEFDSH